MSAHQHSVRESGPIAGQLLVYESNARLAAFVTGSQCESCLIAIGGMTDGLLFADFVSVLATSLPTLLNIAVCSPVLASSYNQFGLATLESDVTDIDALLAQLRKSYPGFKRYFLLGHSTGSQILVTYARIGQHRDNIHGYILHAPVSDSDWLYENIPNVELLYASLHKQCQENPNNLFPGYYPGTPGINVPITVGRLFSLLNDEGRMFSHLTTQQDMERILGHMHPYPVLILYAGADEYAAETADKHQLVERFVAAMAGQPDSKKGVVVDGADHSFHGKEHELLAAVSEWLQRIRT